MPRSILAQFLLLTGRILATPAAAQQEKAHECQDGKRGKVILPQGDKSFADFSKAGWVAQRFLRED